MSLRAAILALLFANLAFLGWATLVDVTPEPAPTESIEHLPQLKLLNEVQNSSGASQRSTVASSATKPRANPAASASASASSSAPAGGSAGTSVNGSTSSSPTQSAAVPRAAAASPAVQRCVTVGPFNDPDRVARADDILQQRGFKLRDRIEQLPQQGFWVFVGGLKSETDEASVVQQLKQNGVSDASVMPDSNAGRRVSVGFFAERDGAERRARIVRGLGLHADIEKRTQDAAVHWVDVNIDSSAQSLPAEGLLALEESGERLEIKECPSDDKAGGDGALSAKTVAQAQPATASKAGTSPSR